MPCRKILYLALCISISDLDEGTFIKSVGDVVLAREENILGDRIKAQ